MSPQSKRRKRKPATRTRSSGPQAVAGEFAARVVRDAARELERVTDVLQAELYVSELLGMWWSLPLIDDDPQVVFGEPVIAYAGTRRRTGALALLRCIAMLGTERQRAKAAAAADALAARGVAESAWAAELGTERVTAIWAYGDVYGDQTSILLGVERSGGEHGVLILVDHTLGGIAKDAFVVDDVAATLGDIRGQAIDPIEWVRELSPEAAGSMLAAAFATTDAMQDAALEPPVNEDFAASRALAIARARLLPATLQAPPVIDAGERRLIVEEFLASDVARDLPARARRCVEHLVDFGAEADRGQPLRVSPPKIERFLGDWLPQQPDVDDEMLDVIPATLAAWAEWAGRRTGLPEEALAELREFVDDVTVAFDEDEFDEDDGLDFGIPPDDVYLVDVDPDDLGEDELADLVARRRFAFPSDSVRVGGEDFHDLDPGDPDERSLLIRGEHPEYDDALDDPTSEEVDGVNPRLHVAIHEIVANQLWDGDPPEVWQTAQRLLRDGVDRHNVLHAIGEVVTTHMHGSLARGEPFRRDRYVADLEKLDSRRWR